MRMKKTNLVKRIISFLIVFVLIIGIYQPVNGGQSQRIRVGFFAFDGYHNMSEDGTRSGYGYEFIQKILRYNNFTAEYVGYDKNWSEMQTMLENGEIDILTSAQKTKEREAKFDFSEPIGTSAAILTVKAGNNKINAGEYDSYNGMRVGVIEGNSRNDRFEEYAREKGFTYTLVYYEDMQKLTEDLQEGSKIDAIVTSNLRCLDNEWILDRFAASPFYAMVQKGDTELLQKVNYAIDQMNSNSVGWKEELFDKYYAGTSGSSISFTSTERAFLDQLKARRTKLKVLVNPDRAPYSYVENGTFQGISVDIFAEIADRLGIDYELVSCSTREEYQELVQSKEIDIILDGRDDYSAAEESGYKLTDPYMNLSYAVVERSDFSGSIDKVAALRLNDTSKANMADILGGRAVVYYDTMKECVDAVLHKKADACYLYDYCGQKYASENVRGELKSTTVPDWEDAISIAVLADQDYRLLTVLNKGVISVRENYVDTAIKNNTDFSIGKLTIMELLWRNPEILMIIVALLALIVILCVYDYQKKKNRESLVDALNAATQASESKGNFLSNMSHEIRTPLNAIIGYLALASEEDVSQEKLKHCIDNCTIASKHLLQIINDILDMSSIESGKLKIAHEDFDLKKEIMDITTIFFQNAKAKGVEFETHVENLTEEWVVGDQLRLNQILMNLLSNAVKFTPENGLVQLSIQQMNEDEKKVYIQFQVRDTGIGMSKEYMSRIFQPFEQENAGTAKKFGGSGLGLSITNHLIKMMGGNITVESEQNIGTTFTVLMYFDRSANSHQKNLVQTDYSKVRVLVVDDKEDECTYVKTMLKRCNVKSDYVTSGEDALKRIRSRMGGDYSYDLCIIDWNMPNMNGGEVTRRIRKELGADLPIIIATAYDVTEFEDEAREAGADRIVAKPLFQSTLFDILVSTFGEYDPSAKADTSRKRVDMSGVHVLLAEDNQMNMEIAVSMLEKAGVIVDQATNGKEAYEIFTSKEKGTYQLILMDVQMPVMDGYEATRTIRSSSHPEAKTIPIIAMTANAFAEDVADALANGMNAHIAKPINYDKLFDLLEKYSQVKEA